MFVPVFCIQLIITIIIGDVPKRTKKYANLNLKDGISNNTQKLDTCDNVIKPVSLIAVVKPTATNEPGPAPEGQQIMFMITTKIKWHVGGEELV